MTIHARIVVLLSCFLLASPALAYDVDIAHVSLATVSLTLYQSCFPASTVYRGSDALNRIIQGNRGMDTGTRDMLHHLKLSRQEDIQLKGRSVFNLAKRITNWHFYNPDRTAHSRIGLVEQSHIRLWRDLKEGLASNKGLNRLIFLGGLMHLTEDVSVPAHAIPVYHGPVQVEELGPVRLRPLVDYMREAGKVNGGMLKDPIDGMKPDVKALADGFVSAAELCSTIGSGEETPETVRDNLARTVYSLLRTAIPGCDGVVWGDFWTDPKEGEYFGLYNVAEGRPLFGESGLVRSQSGGVCQMRENDDRYAAFVMQLHKAAIKADMKLLKWGERQFSL